MTTIKTIRRGTKRAAAVFSNAKTCHCFSLDNSFSGSDCEADWARQQYERFSFAKLRYSTDKPSKVTVRMHSNCWYEITL